MRRVRDEGEGGREEKDLLLRVRAREKIMILDNNNINYNHSEHLKSLLSYSECSKRMHIF